VTARRIALPRPPEELWKRRVILLGAGFVAVAGVLNSPFW
jgi:hypothetical protein